VVMRDRKAACGNAPGSPAAISARTAATRALARSRPIRNWARRLSREIGLPAVARCSASSFLARTRASGWMRSAEIAEALIAVLANDLAYAAVSPVTPEALVGQAHEHRELAARFEVGRGVWRTA
jgi:hypothetical protein